MFSLDTGEFIIIILAALIFIGPKELPGILRQLGNLISSLKNNLSEFQQKFMNIADENDIDKINKEISQINNELSQDVENILDVEQPRKFNKASYKQKVDQE